MHNMLRNNFLREGAKFLLAVLGGLLGGLLIIVIGAVGLGFFNRQICPPKVPPAVEAFLAQVRNGNYENFQNEKDRQKAPTFLSREDFESLKRGISAKHSATIKEWEGTMAFVTVEFASQSAYELTVIPDGSVWDCLGKDYKVIAVRR